MYSSLLPSSFIDCPSFCTQTDNFLLKALAYHCFLLFRCIGEYISLDLICSVNMAVPSGTQIQGIPPPHTQISSVNKNTTNTTFCSEFSVFLKLFPPQIPIKPSNEACRWKHLHIFSGFTSRLTLFLAWLPCKT